MKPGRLLKKAGLYHPVKRLAGRLQAGALSISLRLKRIVHDRAVRRAGKDAHFGGFGPRVLIVMNTDCDEHGGHRQQY